MTRIARGRARMKSRPAIISTAAKKRDSRIGWVTITSRALSPSPSWTTDFTDAPCSPRSCGDLGEHAGPVGDLEVQVERRLDVADDSSAARWPAASRPAGSSR